MVISRTVRKLFAAWTAVASVLMLSVIVYFVAHAHWLITAVSIFVLLPIVVILMMCVVELFCVVEEGES